MSSARNPGFVHSRDKAQVNGVTDDRSENLAVWQKQQQTDMVSNCNSVPRTLNEVSLLSSPNGSSQHIFQDTTEESKSASPWPGLSGYLTGNLSKLENDPNLDQADKVKKLKIFGFDLTNHSSISTHVEKSAPQPTNASNGTHELQASILSAAESDQKSDLSKVSKERISGYSMMSLKESQNKQLCSNSARSRTKVVKVECYL